MPRVELKPTIPVLKKVKTVHVLDHVATVIGLDPNDDTTFFLLPYNEVFVMMT